MFLYEVFPPELIKVDLEAKDKNGAFEELVDQFCEITPFDGREEILSSVKEREAKMSTNIQKGIAIPHGKTNKLERIYGVLGISKDGIDYDGQSVYLLFLILSPYKDAENYLQILKRLAQFLKNPQFSIDIKAQKDVQGISGVIKKYEDMFLDFE